MHGQRSVMHVRFSEVSPNGLVALLSDESIAILTGMDPSHFHVEPHKDGGAFLQVSAAASGSSSRTLTLGALPHKSRVVACSRQKIWWMGPWIGDAADGIPLETQFMLVKLPGEDGGDGLHAVVLPMVTDNTKSCLHGGKGGLIEISTETGCADVRVSPHTDIAYIGTGKDPFVLLEEAFERLSMRTGTFLTRKHKKVPSSLDHFGWCTWDAFYHQVSGTGIQEGLTSLSQGGTPPRFLIIDDGWQDTRSDGDEAEAHSTAFALCGTPPSSLPAPDAVDVRTDDELSLAGIGFGTSRPTAVHANKANTQQAATHPLQRALGYLSNAFRWLSSHLDFCANISARISRLDAYITARLTQTYHERVQNAPHNSPILLLWDVATGTIFRRQFGKIPLPEAAWGKRLISVQTSQRFARTLVEAGSKDGLKGFITSIKADFGVEKVFAWHSLLGYWSGLGGDLARDLTNGKPPQQCVVYPKLSKSVKLMDPILKYWDPMRKGVGVGNSARDLYDKLHGYLADCGVDGVKVDSQAQIGTLGAGRGGVAYFPRSYISALESSVGKHFGEGSINCMCHATECLYAYREGAVIRASDDFWPVDDASHTVHILNVAYNSLFIGEIGIPDWDMFHSKHRSASLHACLRAVGGCSVIVSDKPRDHDFNILKRLVLPDGTTLRALQPGRPTRDCLFNDTAMDRVSALKIWNRNRFSGVLGAFNVQGAKWRSDFRQFWIYDWNPPVVRTRVTPADVEFTSSLNNTGHGGDFVVFATLWDAEGSLKHRTVTKVSRHSGPECELRHLESFMCTVCPVLNLGRTQWAPIGLRDMYNAGGAVLSARLEASSKGPLGCAQVVGQGAFIAFASSTPAECALITGNECIALEYQWEPVEGGGLITLHLPENAAGASKERTLSYNFSG